MWCFNEEQVAYAIYNSKIPIISAVGHEIDFTIADFVADLRAPTPTGAAEMAVPNKNDIINYLNQINIRLNKSILHTISTSKEKLSSLSNSFVLKNPISIYEIKEQKFDNLFEKLNIVIINLLKGYRNIYELKFDKLNSNIVKTLEYNQNKYTNNLNKLEILNPLLTIKRGYSISKKNNKVITSINNINIGDKVDISLTDGKLETTVIKKEKNND